MKSHAKSHRKSTNETMRRIVLERDDYWAEGPVNHGTCRVEIHFRCIAFCVNAVFQRILSLSLSLACSYQLSLCYQLCTTVLYIAPYVHTCSSFFFTTSTVFLCPFSPRFAYFHLFFYFYCVVGLSILFLWPFHRNQQQKSIQIYIYSAHQWKKKIKKTFS